MEEEFKDKILTCRICRERFTWTVGEQRYYRSRFLAPPRTCPDCRPSKRREAVGNA